MRETTKQDAFSSWKQARALNRTQREFRSRRSLRIDAGRDRWRGDLYSTEEGVSTWCSYGRREEGASWDGKGKTCKCFADEVMSWQHLERTTQTNKNKRQRRQQRSVGAQSHREENKWTSSLKGWKHLTPTEEEALQMHRKDDWKLIPEPCRRARADPQTQHGAEEKEPVEDGQTLLQLADWHTVNRYCQVRGKSWQGKWLQMRNSLML